MVFFISLIICLIFGFIGSAIASEKNRDSFEGFLYGFFLSVFGLIIVAVLPTKEKKIVLKTTQKIDNSEIRRETNYEIEKKSENESKSINKVIWLLLFFVLIIVIVLVGIKSADKNNQLSILKNEIEISNVNDTNEESSTNIGKSNNKADEQIDSIKALNKQKVNATKSESKKEKIRLLSKVFDSAYGKDLALEIANEIYSEKINVDSIRYFKIEDGESKILKQYKNIKLYNLNRKQLFEFKDVRIEGFIDYLTNNQKNFLPKKQTLRKFEDKAYPFKRNLFGELLTDLKFNSDNTEKILEYLDRDMALLIRPQFDSITISKNGSNYLVVNLFNYGKYTGSIDFPFAISDDFISKK